MENVLARELVSKWTASFQKGMEFDLWGQRLEATQFYQRVSGHIRSESTPNSARFTDSQKKILNKIAACLELRIRSLQSSDDNQDISLPTLRTVENCLRNVCTEEVKDFPLNVRTHPAQSVCLSSYPDANLDSNSNHTSYNSSSRISADDADLEEDEIDPRLKGSLLPPIRLLPDHTPVTIHINRIDLREPAQYIDPFITISIKDSSGFDISQVQDTPVTSRKEDFSILFGVDVNLQKPLEILPPGFTVFFEFKHYKPKKKIVSTKCWACMEKDEITDGSTALELYKKPTSYQRKKLNLLTIKPLFLHLRIVLNTS